MDDTEDSFDDLSLHLPKYQSDVAFCPQGGDARRDDNFQNWIISRYGRIGSTSIFRIIASSFQEICAHLVLPSVSYGAFLAIDWIFMSKMGICISTAYHAAFYLASYSILYFYRSNPNSTSIRRIISVPGAFSFLSIYISSIVRQMFDDSIKNRSSTATFWFASTAVFELATLFIPCLLFDSKLTDPLQMLQFTWKALGQSKALMHAFAILAMQYLCRHAATITFGVSWWLAVESRIYFFTTICGTSAPSSAPKADTF